MHQVFGAKLIPTCLLSVVILKHVMHTCLHMYVYAQRLLLKFIRSYHSMYTLACILYIITVSRNTLRMYIHAK